MDEGRKLSPDAAKRSRAASRPIKPLTRAQLAIVDTGTTISLDPATSKESAYLARPFVLATLPHSDPKADTWSRKNGNFTLGVQAGFDVRSGKSFGLPYGVIPRLLLYWITREALRSGPRLQLGASIAAFMREVGLNPDTGGGARGDARRLQDQMKRLFHARISFWEQLEEDGRQGERWSHMQVSAEGVLWWDVKSPEQGTLWNSWVELDPKFYDALIAAPVPVDTRALRVLKRSPFALDLYALLCFEGFKIAHTGRTRFIPWRSLMEQLGADYKVKDAHREFGRKARAALRKVLAVCPTVRVEVIDGGFYIKEGSRPAIPKK